MADNAEKTAQDSAPSQINADDNRRRTRSQTRNGGITPVASVPEPKGKKRASQSQPNSGGKRGRKAAQAVPPAELQRDTEEHSKKKAENQDLSKRKLTDPADKHEKKDIGTKPAEKADPATEEAAPAEKTSDDHHEAQKEGTPEEVSQGACRAKRSGRDTAPKAKVAKKSADAASKRDAKTTEQAETETPAITVAPDDAKPKDEQEEKPKTNQPEPEESEDKNQNNGSKVDGEKAQDSPVECPSEPETKSVDSTPKPTSEQTKIDVSEDTSEAKTTDEKAENNTNTNDEKDATAHQTKLQESGDSKLDSAINDAAKKSEEIKVAEKADSATPV